jgi:hypothetical protein
MTYQGRCHCGQIAYEVEGDLTQVIECNCTHCSRKGYLLWFVDREQIRLTTSEDSIGKYRFNKHVIDHCFCKNCGCAPFGMGTDATGKAKTAVNARCLEGVDLGAVKRIQADGLHRA